MFLLGGPGGSNEPGFASLLLLWAPLVAEMAPRHPQRVSETPYITIFYDLGTPLQGFRFCFC